MWSRSLLSRAVAAVVAAAVAAVVAATSLAGCKDLTTNPGLPAGTPDPSVYQNKAGAIGMRNAAVQQFEFSLPMYIVDAGLLSDELQDRSANGLPGSIVSTGIIDSLDERILRDGAAVGQRSYANLQNIRAFANQAIGALAAYDTAAADRESARVLQGELYALEGYAEIMLADLFCSGIPLSTLDFQQDFTYRPSLTTAQVYQDAIAKFDTALALADTNTSIINLARVGKGRTWLELGQYDSAVTAVATIPDAFQYQLSITWGGNCEGMCATSNSFLGTAKVSDREGVNGLPYRSGNDPRTTVVGLVDAMTNDSVYFPAKYIAALTGNGYTPITIADGIEARLIRAEGAYHGVGTGQGSWLDQLNALRRTALAQNQTTPVPDDLTDPGQGLSGTSADSARVALLFRERAYWLFATGHRQGDLRRLLREYRQAGYQRQDQVYPAGFYFGPGTGVYGTDVNVPIPPTEDANPLFHGCMNRNA